MNCLSSLTYFSYKICTLFKKYCPSFGRHMSWSEVKLWWIALIISKVISLKRVTVRLHFLKIYRIKKLDWRKIRVYSEDVFQFWTWTVKKIRSWVSFENNSEAIVGLTKCCRLVSNSINTYEYVNFYVLITWYDTAWNNLIIHRFILCIIWNYRKYMYRVSTCKWMFSVLYVTYL